MLICRTFLVRRTRTPDHLIALVLTLSLHRFCTVRARWNRSGKRRSTLKGGSPLALRMQWRRSCAPSLICLTGAENGERASLSPALVLP